MKKLWMIALAAVVAVGCQSTPRQPKQEKAYEPVPLTYDEALEGSGWNSSRTIAPDDLGGTRDGDTFLAGKARVERIVRHSSDGYIDSRITIRNTSGSDLTGEYRIVYYDDMGKPVSSPFSQWKFFILPKNDFAYLNDHTMVQGGMDLKLFIRESSGINADEANPPLEEAYPEPLMSGRARKVVVQPKTMKKMEDEPNSDTNDAPARKRNWGAPATQGASGK